MAGYLGPYEHAGVPSAGTDAVQHIVRDATVDGGTFTVAFRGAETSALEFDVSAADFQTALRAVYQVGGANVTVTGTGTPEIDEDPADPWVVTFIADLGKRVQPLLTVADNSLTAEDEAVEDAVTITEATAGVNATRIGARKGALLTDVTNGVLYINTNTAASPTWTKVGTQT